MNNYPEWKPDADKRSHLLFDFGYSYALLSETQRILSHMLDSGEVNFPVLEDLVESFKGFKAGRLKDVSEIYDITDKEFVEMLSRPRDRTE
jgi:hypothetical protein